jgi:hypothetical protein
MRVREVLRLTGDIMPMPGLLKQPAAENIGINENGDAVGLFQEADHFITHWGYRNRFVFLYVSRQLTTSRP